MILNHLWGIYAHPLEEWQTIDNRHESLTYSLSHILLIALFPAVMGYYSSVYLGWSIGAGNPVFLTHDSAILIAAAMYAALIVGVFALAYLAHWMAVTFGAKPTFTQTLELAAYTSTPVFMSALAAFWPELWFVVCAGAGFFLSTLVRALGFIFIVFFFSSPRHIMDQWYRKS